MMKSSALCKAMLAGASALVLGAAMASSALAADVTPGRLAKCRQGAAQLADEPSDLRCTAIFTT